MRLFLSILSFCIMTSCATLSHGSRQEIEVTSTPEGAHVTDGIHVWKTPAKISLPRKTARLIAFFKPGYNPETVRLKRLDSGAVVGNILMPLGVVGWGIDVMTGSCWKLHPEKIHMDLTKT